MLIVVAQVTLLVVGWRRTADDAVDTARGIARRAGASHTVAVGSHADPGSDIMVAAFAVSFDALSAALELVDALEASVAVHELRAVLHSAVIDIDSIEPGDLAEAWGVELLPNLPDQLLVSSSIACMVDSLLPRGYELAQTGVESLLPARPPEPLHELRRVGPAPGPGRARVPTWHASAPGSNLGWARRAAAGWLVDREEPSARIRAAWEASIDGRRSAPLLLGAPGVGKTTLAADLALKTAARGTHVIYGRWERGSRPVYEAIREGLDASSVGPSFDLHPTDVRPFPTRGPALVDGHADSDAAWLGESLATWLDGLAVRRPVLVVLDDMHWADPSSLALLASLQDAGSPAPWMALTTMRSGSGDPPDWAERLELGGLVPDAVAALVELTLGIGEPPDDAAIEWMMTQTAGNPLLVHELLRGVVGHADPLRDLVSGHGRPRGVVDVVRWRLGLLPPETRDILCHAAGMGPTIGVDRLAGRLGMAPALVRRAITPALSEDIVRSGPEQDNYSFSNQVTWHVLQADLMDAM